MVQERSGSRRFIISASEIPEIRAMERIFNKNPVFGPYGIFSRVHSGL